MAEKKISVKTKKRIPAPERDNSYDDFLAQYGPDLRKRSTRTVNEPVKKAGTVSTEESRCGEINPHTTVNPVIQHQILTKRTGRILSDDTGFKAESYNQRFELTPEMPEISDSKDDVEQIELPENQIPGQRTMADLVSDNTQEDIAVPIEGQISDEDENPFLSAYKAIKNEGYVNFGKSEKLRAIARTAADDVGMEPDSQLAFPAFDPIFKFPEEKSKKKKLKKIKKEKTKETASFDIDEKEIVTSHSSDNEKEEVAQPKKAANEKLQDRKKKVFKVLSDNVNTQKVAPPFEIGSKNEVHSILGKLTKYSRTALIKSCILLSVALILLLLLSLLKTANPVICSVLCVFALIISAIVCVKELTDGIKDIKRFRFSLNSGALLIFISATIQTVASFFTVSDISKGTGLLVPAAVISLISATLPKFFLANNSKLTAGMLTYEKLSVFRNLSDGGIEGALQNKFTQSNDCMRYSSDTAFLTGIMSKLTNAIPKPFAINAVYILVTVISVISAIASGIIKSDAMTGITVFTGMMIACLPVTFTISAALMLYNTNSSLSKHKTSVISYRCAGDVVNTKAIVLNASEVIEQSACSIHGVKTFGYTDPKKATIFCAAAINAGLSPLASIMKQVTDQGEMTVPEAENTEVYASGGIKATVENNTVLLGSREFLTSNGVHIPDGNFEEELITGDRKLLYFAVNGNFAMLLIVSYHIKRSVAAFFKYLTSNGIKIVIHSSDPNITPEYITKKCKLGSKNIFETTDAETLYFLDKEKRTETAMPADVFTDGSIGALSKLMRSSFCLNKIFNTLPMVVYTLSAISILLITLTVFLGSALTISNLFIIVLRIVSFAITIASLKFLSKQ